MTARVVVIGVGNDWRGDDAAGLVTARRARARLPRDVAVYELDGEPARLIDAWDGADVAVVVDAARTGAAPGTVHVFEPASVTEAPARATASSHAVGVLDSFRLARALDRLPGRVVVIGVEVGATGVGRKLTRAVAVGTRRAADEIVALAAAMRSVERV